MERPPEDKNCSGSDGNADLCGTDYEAQSDPQTGSPPRDKSNTRTKGFLETEFAQQESSDRKPKLFRSSASTGKKKHSLSIGVESINPDSIAVCIFQNIFILNIYIQTLIN